MLQIRKSVLFLIAFSLVTTSCDLEFDQGNFQPHVYLNWRSEDTFTTIQVNYHTKGTFTESAVLYDTESRDGNPANYKLKATGRVVKWPGTDRAVHHVELTNLAPGKPYYFITGDAQSGYTPERKFKTLDPADASLRIVNGGDMGTGTTYENMTALAATYDPDVALLGGDIAYENGDPKETALWDKWLSVWTSKMVTSTGFTVPMILAIGNHETNLKKIFGKREHKAPFYYSLFDQDPDRLSYFTRKISDDIMLFALDTAHLYAPFGKQRKWLMQAMEENKTVRTKIAIYHAGIYPSHRSYINPHNMLGRLSWLKIFDHFKLSLGLEHHDHSLKRTKYIKDGEVSKAGEGTLYVGDGAWGKNGREVHPDRWYLEHAEDVANFWFIDATETQISLSAIGENGKVLDSHVMPRLAANSPLIKANAIGKFKDDSKELMDTIRKDKEMSKYLHLLEGE